MKCRAFLVYFVAAILILSTPITVFGGSFTTTQKEKSTPMATESSTYPFADHYPSLNELYNWYDTLVAENPNITKKIDIGESWEGRDMWVIKISDNVEQNEEEPSFFVHGNIHAREWSGNEVASYYLWRMVNDYDSNETIRWLVENREIYVAPVVNPDGYVYDGNGNYGGDGEGNHWRKNRNDETPTDSVGVDLNRNWDIKWSQGNGDATSSTYHGESPFSEYETQNLRDFILDKDIDAYHDLHSYAGTLLIPWAYTGDDCPHDQWYRDMAADMTSLTSQLGDDSLQYSYGQAEEEIGYSAPGGTFDWVYEETGAVGLGFEIYTGRWDGFYPPEENIMDINLDLYESLVYQTRISDSDLGTGSLNEFPPAPYLLYGNLTDSLDGDPLSDALVTLKNTQTGETLSVKTDENGYYEINFADLTKNGYDDSDDFVLQAAGIEKTFSIGSEWGQKIDLEAEVGERASVNLNSPEGTEIWIGGDEEEINWSSQSGDTQTTGIDLEYSVDGGSSWDTIVKFTEDDGNYSWEVPKVMSTECMVRGTLYDGYGISDTDTSDGTFEIVEKQIEIPLQAGGESEGWNLVSFDLKKSETGLTSILENDSLGIQGNYDKVMYYDSSDSGWRSYLPDRADRYNDLQQWDHSMAVWIHMTEDDNLTLRGSEFNSTMIDLHPGWNMVGYPSSRGGNNDLPAEVDKIGYVDESMENNVNYTGSVDSYQFEPKEGYWIHNPTGSTLTWQVRY
ncbi:MAG: hypothetical protein KGY76_05305 [Candidatus Thermoplasmatota archaeon]|nr:hypothetical protein [Candidatus Thermoplasmatota archaeon]